MQADDGDGQNIQNSIEGYIRTRTGEKGAVTPEDFPWRWGIVYGEDPAALPPYEGKTAAVLADRPEDGKPRSDGSVRALKGNLQENQYSGGQHAADC